MEETKEQIKIREARYLIIIPLVITIVCGWLDIWTNYSIGESVEQATIAGIEATANSLDNQESLEGSKFTVTILNEESITSKITSIIRCAMGYLFPSVVSIVSAMIWQQRSLGDEAYGIPKRRVEVSLIFTVIYFVVFISCLINYNFAAALVLCGVTIAYMCLVYKYGLDDRIKIKNKNDMNEEELISLYVKKNGFNE